MALTVIPIALIYVVILGIGLVTATRRSVAVTEREMSQLCVDPLRKGSTASFVGWQMPRR